MSFKDHGTTDDELRDRMTLAILGFLENGQLDKLKLDWWKKGAKICSPSVSDVINLNYF